MFYFSSVQGRTGYPLEPYLLFDIWEGQEQRSQSSR